MSGHIFLVSFVASFVENLDGLAKIDKLCDKARDKVIGIDDFIPR